MLTRFSLVVELLRRLFWVGKLLDAREQVLILVQFTEKRIMLCVKPVFARRFAWKCLLIACSEEMHVFPAELFTVNACNSIYRF